MRQGPLVVAAFCILLLHLLLRDDPGSPEQTPEAVPAAVHEKGPRPLLRGSAPTEEELLDAADGAAVVPEGVEHGIHPTDAEMAGRVVGPDGASLRGAVVRAFLDRPGGGREYLGGVGTAAFGRFWLRLSRTEELVHLLIVGPADAEEPVAPTVVRDVRPGQEGLELEVEPGVWLEGRVEDPEGEAIKGASVALWGAREDPETPRRQEVHDGRFRFAVAPGRYRVLADPRQRGLTASPTVVVRTPSNSVRLVCSVGTTIRGRLLGAEIEGFQVGWSRPLVDRAGRSGSVRVRRDDGRFVLEDVPPEQVTLHAWKADDDRCAWRVVDATSGAELELELVPGLSIEGWVTAGRSPGWNVWLNVWDLQLKVWRNVRVAGDGSFCVPGLPPGRYDLRVVGVAALRGVEAGSTGVRLEAVPGRR